METCLRPGCDTEMHTIGVCVGCANSEWEPTKTGVELSDGFVTWGADNPLLRGYTRQR